jgi:hypothetical protein
MVGRCLAKSYNSGRVDGLHKELKEVYVSKERDEHMSILHLKLIYGVFG